MRRHTAIRAAVIGAVKQYAGDVTIHDGRPVFLSEGDLPAMAVYLTNAVPCGDLLDEDLWEAVLHIEIFLKAAHPDSALDARAEDVIRPAMLSVPALSALSVSISPLGYDYQRDEEMSLWGSADLTYRITYSI